MEIYENMLYYVTKILQEYTSDQPNEYLQLLSIFLFVTIIRKLKKMVPTSNWEKKFTERFASHGFFNK